MTRLINFKKKSAYLFLAIAGILISFSSCKKHTVAPQTTVYFHGTFTGSAVMPPAQTHATGAITATYNELTTYLQYSVTWSNLSGIPTAVDIYSGTSGKNGVIVYTIKNFPKNANGTISGEIRLTKIQANELISGQYYISIFTVKYPKGELRAQIIKK